MNTPTENQQPQTATLPGAWYDLTCRVRSAQAVASCALEGLPCNADAGERINHVGDLIAAMQDLLKLMQQDVAVIEKALHA